MKNRVLRRGVLAVSAALSLLVLLATPGGSDEILSGTLEIGDPVQWVFDVGEDEDPPCDIGEKGFPYLEPDLHPELDFEVDGDDQAGDWRTSGLLTRTFELDGDWHQITFLADDFPPAFTTGPAGSYTWDATHEHWELEGGGTIWFAIEEIDVPDPPDPEEPCEKDELVCLGLAEGVVVPHSYDEGPWPPASPGTLFVNAESAAPHIQMAGCQQPFFALVGEEAMLNDLVIEL